MNFTIFLIIWIVSIIAALIISRNVWGFWLGALLGPLGVFLIVLLGKRCPHCKLWIKRDVRTCPKCSKDIE